MYHKFWVMSMLLMNYLPLECWHFEVWASCFNGHFLELKKFYGRGQYDRNNSLHRWMKYFDSNLKEDELKELVRMDGAIAAAEERNKRAAASEKEMRYYEAMEDARRNMICKNFLTNTDQMIKRAV